MSKKGIFLYSRYGKGTDIFTYGRCVKESEMFSILCASKKGFFSVECVEERETSIWSGTVRDGVLCMWSTGVQTGEVFCIVGAYMGIS